MDRTIGGKSLEEISLEISKKFGHEEYDSTENGNQYIKIEAVKKRFYDLFGPFKFDMTFSDPEVHTLQFCEGEDKYNEYIFTVKCAIIFKDDQGTNVCRVEGIGASNATYKKESHKPVDLANDIKICKSLALKDCLRNFGIGALDVDDDTPSKKKTNLDGVGKNVSELHSDETHQYDVRIIEQIVQRGKKGYSVKVCVNGSENMPMVLWKDQMERNLRDSAYDMDSFLKLLQPGMEVKLFGKIETYQNEKRLTFAGV